MFMVVAELSSLNLLSLKMFIDIWHNVSSQKWWSNFSFQVLEPDVWFEKLYGTAAESFKIEI